MPEHDRIESAAAASALAPFTPDPRLVEVSRDVLARLQAPSGAYPASPTFSAYRGHCWFRDGSFIAEAARRHGDADGSARFHRWCTGVVLDRATHIEDLVRRGLDGSDVAVEEMLPTRYTLDGADGTDAWWDFQLDGYGTWLWALCEHADACGSPDPAAPRAAALVADYLSVFWDRPCYDWWEEHVDRRHVSTLAAVRAGLDRAVSHPVMGSAMSEATRARAAAVVGAVDAVVREGGTGRAPATRTQVAHLLKWLGADAVDASLLSCVVPFELPMPDDVAESTVEAVETQLAVDGGVHRYLADTYYGGGQWLLLSGFLAWAHARRGRVDDAARYLRWIEERTDPDGLMPEQVNAHLLAPEREREWIERWGESASPLLWSHAMYLIAVDELERRSRTTPHPREETP